jgi:hypothetical protein
VAALKPDKAGRMSCPKLVSVSEGAPTMAGLSHELRTLVARALSERLDNGRRIRDIPRVASVPKAPQTFTRPLTGGGWRPSAGGGV